MAETVIRINKRTLERTFFIVVIVVLAALLVWRWNAGGDTSALDDQVTQLTQDNEDLQAQLDTAQADLEDAQHQLELLEQAEQERQAAINATNETNTTVVVPEEPQLSGELSFDWSVNADAEGKISRITIVFQNGIDRVQTVDYKIFWDNYYEETINVDGTITARSGESKSAIVIPDDEGFKPTPPPDTNTLVVEFTDSDGDLIDRLEEQV